MIAVRFSPNLLSALKNFLSRNLTKEDSEHSIDGLIKFLMRLSKFDTSHEPIMMNNVHEVIFLFVTKPYYIEILQKMSRLVETTEN